MLTLLSDELLRLLKDEDISSLKGTKTNTTLISSVSNNILKSKDLGPEYWTSNLVSPVGFSTAVSTLISEFPKEQNNPYSATLL